MKISLKLTRAPSSMERKQTHFFPWNNKLDKYNESETG